MVAPAPARKAADDWRGRPDPRIRARRRGQPGDLLDCIQLADKAAILTRSAEFLAGTRFASKRQADDAFQRIQALRNALAHAQSSIASSDWKLVVQLAHSVDSLSVVL